MIDALLTEVGLPQKKCNFCGKLKVRIPLRKDKTNRNVCADENGKVWNKAKCPECQAETMRQYRADNLDRLQEQDRLRNQTPERKAKDRERSKTPKRREQHTISAAKFSKTPKRKAWLKEWEVDYYARPEVIERTKERRSIYYARPEVKAKRRLRIAIRKFQIENTDDGTITDESLNELRYELQSNCCAYCFVNLDTVKVHLDHVIPLYRDGVHQLWNVLYACAFCNVSKGDKLLSEWLDEHSVELICRAQSVKPAQNVVLKN